jgi:hydrogenase maturation protease
VILVAGIGNIFLGDDAFGCEVIRALPARADVEIVDFGIRGYDLAMRLDEPWRAVVLVDAARRGGPPGTLYVIEPDQTPRELQIDAHALDPATVLALAAARQRVVRLVACEPETFGTDEDPALGLSDPVAAAIPNAVALVERLLGELAHA